MTTIHQANAQGIYLAAKDFAWEYAKQVLEDGGDLRLDDLVEQIYTHLTTQTSYRSYTVICMDKAEQAAKRVFDQPPTVL